MKLAVMLPTFEQDVDAAFEVAARASAAGLHGVLCYDHLWPMGQPGDPAISPYPLLAALAIELPELVVGTLVSRVGLEPDEVLAAELATTASLAPRRFIAALGTGDYKSAEENDAFGIPLESADDRRAAVVHVAELLEPSSAEIWIGGGSTATNDLARELRVTLNLWAASPELVAAEAARGPVSWGGVLSHNVERAARKLDQLARAGASWAAISGSAAVEHLVEAADRAGIALRH